MPAPLPADQRRSEQILSRVTRAERADLRRIAAQRKVKVSALIRESLVAAGHLPPTTR